MNFYKPMLAKPISKPFPAKIGFLKLNGTVLERLLTFEIVFRFRVETAMNSSMLFPRLRNLDN